MTTKHPEFEEPSADELRAPSAFVKIVIPGEAIKSLIEKRSGLGVRQDRISSRELVDYVVTRVLEEHDKKDPTFHGKLDTLVVKVWVEM